MTVDDASAALSESRYTLLVVGTTGEGGPHFMIANWGTQASFDPWRYVVALKRGSRTRANVERARGFTINLLDATQAALVKDLMKRKGDGVAAEAGPERAPRLPQAYAGFDCRHLQTIDVGGDHVLVVGEVVDGWKREGGPAETLGELDLSYAG